MQPLKFWSQVMPPAVEIYVPFESINSLEMLLDPDGDRTLGHECDIWNCLL